MHGHDRRQSQSHPAWGGLLYHFRGSSEDRLAATPFVTHLPVSVLYDRGVGSTPRENALFTHYILIHETFYQLL